MADNAEKIEKSADSKSEEKITEKSKLNGEDVDFT
jgi:hypothetical protein